MQAYLSGLRSPRRQIKRKIVGNHPESTRMAGYSLHIPHMPYITHVQIKKKYIYTHHISYIVPWHMVAQI